MSSSFANPPEEQDRLGGGGGLRLGERPETSPFTSDLDAPSFSRTPRTSLTPVTTGDETDIIPLSDLALGRAKELLDAVRNRRVTWQRAKPFLDVLSIDDRKTLVATRSDLSEDEKRALGLTTKGGGGLGGIGGFLNKAWEKGLKTSGISGALEAPKVLGIGDNIVGDTISNLAGDASTLVKDFPAGMVKTGIAFSQDAAYDLAHPGRGSSLLNVIRGEAPESRTREEIINPTLKQYANTYGPLFRGDPGETARKIQEHPLGPLLDLFAVASLGYGTVARGIAAERAIQAQRVTREADGTLRMGKVDRTNQTYQPLGINMDFYVRPTTQQIHNDPWSGRFSVIIDPESGKSIFSPVGSSHGEIYDALYGRTWPDGVHPTNHIQATGVFDPATGKVARINIDPEDMVGPHVAKMPQLLKDVKDQAEATYITGSQLKSMSKTNEKGTIAIKQGDTKRRYDPATGEKIGPRWYIVNAAGTRVGANFPDEASAIAHAQSHVTGGILPDVLETELKTYFEPARGELGIMKLAREEPFEARSFGMGEGDISSVLQEVRGWRGGYYQPRPGAEGGQRFVVGANEMAESALRSFTDPDAGMISGAGPNARLMVLRDEQGKVAAVGNYNKLEPPFGREGDVGLESVYVGSVGGRVPGAGVALVREIAKENPGLRIEFTAANPKTKAYYERMGAKENEFGLMEITAEDAAKLVQGEAPVQGPRRRERLAAAKEPKTPLQVGREAFFQRRRGSLLEAFESVRGKSHTKEIEGIVSEVITDVLDNPDLRLEKLGAMEALQEALGRISEDITRTHGKDVAKYMERMERHPEFQSPATSAAISALGITAREVSDLVRAGAIFLRPAYIPNNWAGNAFLNTIHAGVYAPTNLAKALVIDKHIGTLYTRGIDSSMGFNAANLMTSERGTGYVAAATDPVAKLMGSIADQPFRRAAWIEEARKAGYKTMGDIQRLWDAGYKERAKFEGRRGAGELEWDPKTTPALHEIGKISRAAQEEIIKFGKYSDIERSVLRNIIFVYSWMRGAGRYFGRFPFQHPVQAAAMMNYANVGQNWLNEEMGGVPHFLVGAIPVGKDKNGNTILINPFSVNPLGTGQEMIAAAASAKEIISDPDAFNKYSQTDPIGLLNPLIQNTVEAYTGGRPLTESIPDTIAALRLKENLEHPGRGQVYPTSRTEALGQYLAGSMFPRKSSQAAITRSLQRERADQPELRIDDEVALFEERTGREVPKKFITRYRNDLEKLERQKDFQDEYAKDHGRQGFTNMPPKNRAEAALDYLVKYHLISSSTVDNVERAIERTTTDADMNDLANLLWRQTGAGSVKDIWDKHIRGIQEATELTPARP